MDIRGILLCGGASTRFGSNKLLAPIPGADPAEAVVVRAARHLHEGVGNVLAVIPLGAAGLRAALEPLGCEVLETDRTARGMGASLAAGVEAADRADGWIVGLGDMPLVTPSTSRAVRAALESGATLAAPVARSDGVRGHPVGFSSALRAELLALDGDRGARDVVARHRAELRAIACDDPGIFVDLDTPEQLAALAQRRG